MTLKNTARVTGLVYLLLAISGMLAFLLIRNQLYVPGDAAVTTANLVEHEGLARLGVAAELTLVLSQAIAALWFFRLFRSVNSFAAGSLAAFGLVNSVVLLVATMFSATALHVALDTSPPAGTALLLYDLNGAAWSVGALFFGLWLIPMGWLAWRSGYMPRLLGWILIGGGIGYVLSAFAFYLAPDASVIAEALTVPASIGEFWMIGYLLVRGVRNEALVAERAATAQQHAPHLPPPGVAAAS